jgi:hypothetical protein
VETQLREKTLWGSQTQDIHYSENKASNKVVTLTYPMQRLYLVPRHVTQRERLPTSLFLKGLQWNSLAKDSSLS